MPRRVGCRRPRNCSADRRRGRASSSLAADADPAPRGSGRVRHEEKITVYVSADELLALEQARLTLRARHGMAVDRGRIVREAIAATLADLRRAPTTPSWSAGCPRRDPILSAEVATEAGLPDRAARTPDGGGFEVHLDNFDGPFDLLLQLISRHKLDITEVALSQVTDEFIAHIKAAGAGWDLDQTSQFMVVAATLLDLKAARLHPVRRGRGSRGPGLAGGPGPAVRPAAAVPRLPAGGQLSSPRLSRRRAAGFRARSGWSRGSPGCCPR